MAQVRKLTEAELRSPTRETSLIAKIMGKPRKTLGVVDELGNELASVWVYAAPSFFSEKELFVRNMNYQAQNFFLENVPERIELLQRIQLEAKDIKMQAERKIFNESGDLIFHAVADPGMSGVSVTMAAIWHTEAHLALYKQHFDELSTWLAEVKELETI